MVPYNLSAAVSSQNETDDRSVEQLSHKRATLARLTTSYGPFQLQLSTLKSRRAHRSLPHHNSKTK
jgi:hypothetical protein